MRHSGSLARRVILGSILASVAMMALSASAEAAYTIGPLELNGGTLPAIQIPSILSFHQAIVSHPTSPAYGKGTHPSSASELTITKVVDKSSPTLFQATVKGSHYKYGSMTWQTTSGTVFGAVCLTDVFPTSYVLGGQALGGQSGKQTESISFGYGKIQTVYGPSASCNGSSAPPVETTLVGLNRSASSLTVRVDCLTSLCKGDLAISLPKAACPTGGSDCSFTGGVRVAINGTGGKAILNGSGSASIGGVELGGAGNFSMGDGSVRVLRLAVPSRLGKWLTGNKHATLGTIIVVRGLNKAIVERELLGAPAKIYASIPSLDAPEPPAGGGGGPVEPPKEPPKDLSQSLVVNECSSPVVGTPTVVSIKGALSPARSGAKVTLTYTPVSGPPPTPAPVVDTVTTDAAGNFGENFDRNNHSWNVVASIAEGDGYAAASSPACAVPIP
jgi:type VI protein secretion system component Hcp